jgi:hypothetical protein
MDELNDGIHGNSFGEGLEPSVFVDLKRVLEMFDPSLVGKSPLDQYHIEPARLIEPMPLR